MFATATLVVPTDYVKTAERVLRAMLCVSELVVNEDKMIIKYYPRFDNVSDEWVKMFEKHLPYIHEDLHHHDKERRADRAYEHILSTSEFIVLVECYGRDRCLQLARLIIPTSNRRNREIPS